MPNQISHGFHHVALLGRPNVGKSTLFNRLLGKRQAVVADVAGTTRDRLLELVKHNGTEFVLVDMAGIEPALSDANEISQGMQKQIEQALAQASLIVWVVDQAGVTAQDEKVAELLRRLNKPVVVAVNKCDDTMHEINQFEFTQFGFAPIVPISAMHARGILELKEHVVAELKQLPAPATEAADFEDGTDRELRLAIIGRPNVGKSTLLNALSGEYRAVVSPVSGTTRDAIDTVLPAKQIFGNTFTKFQTIRIIDTAGIRQRSKMGHEVEAWSVLRSLDTLDAADVALLLVDATEGVTHQDMIVAEKILKSGKPLVLVINKWDAVLAPKNLIAGTEEDTKEQEILMARILRKAPFLRWTQVIFVSASEGLNLQHLGNLINRAYLAWTKEPDEKSLNEIVAELKKNPRLRNLTGITFQRAKPPVFVMHVNSSVVTHFTTRRFVENALRDYLELGPTPIKIWVERNFTDRRRKR